MKVIKAIWDWIYREVGTVLTALKEPQSLGGKFSWKRITGAVALYVAIRLAFAGAWISSLVFLVYVIVIGIFIALKKA